MSAEKGQLAGDPARELAALVRIREGGGFQMSLQILVANPLQVRWPANANPRRLFDLVPILKPVSLLIFHFKEVPSDPGFPDRPPHPRFKLTEASPGKPPIRPSPQNRITCGAPNCSMA